MLNDFHIAYVNLNHRNDRREHMQTELDRVGIKAERVRGMLPDEVEDMYKLKGLNLSKLQVMKRRTPGAIGCHYSQVSIMERALELNKHAWVMEDDLIFCDDFQLRLGYIFSWLQRNDWDVFWLGGTFHSPAFWHPKGPSKMAPDCSAHLGKDVEPTDEPRILRTYGAFCTYAYLVNKNSIGKILTLLDENMHNSIGIDWLFISLQPRLNTFAFVPGSVKQMDSQSDIGEGVTYFSGFSKLNGNEENSKYWFQERLEYFNPKTWEWK